MTRWLSVLCVLATGTALLAAKDKQEADDKTSAKFQVTRLEIRNYPPPKPGTFTFMNNGTTMDVMVKSSGKHLSGVDFKASKLTSFTDDKKTNLHTKPAGFFVGGSGGSDWLNEFFVQYTPEGDAVTIQVKSNAKPAKGAEKILLKASLVLLMGKDEKATEKKEIAFKSNEESAVGPFKVKISQFGNQFNVIATEQKLKNVEILDENGKEMKFVGPNRILQMQGAKTEYIYSYILFQKPTKLSIKVNYFEKVESVKVPMDLQVGLGLP